MIYDLFCLKAGVWCLQKDFSVLCGLKWEKASRESYAEAMQVSYERYQR